MPPFSWAHQAARARSARAPRRAALRLTPLEERAVPATFRWVNPGGGDVATAANWQDQNGNPGVPAAADDALILVPGITVTSTGTTFVHDLTSVATLDVAAGTLTAAAASLTGPLAVTGGTLVLDGSSSAAAVSLAAGTVGGSGQLAVTGSMSWTGGAVAIDLDVAAGATLDVGGSGTDTLDGSTLTNEGTTTWDGTGPLHFQNLASVQNNGTWIDEADHAATTSGSLGFHNRGRYVKSAGAGVCDFGVTFDNTGRLDVDSGTLRLSGGISQVQFGFLQGGTWGVSGGATLDVPGLSLFGSSAAVTLTGAGSTFTALGGVDDNSGSFTVTGGAAFAAPGSFFNSGSVTIGPGSTLTASGFDQSAAGRLTLQVGGRPGSGLFGRLVDNSVTTLNGTVEVAVVPGADTQGGDGYTLVSGTAIGGSPAVRQGGAGLTPVFNVAVGGTAVTATAAQSVTDLAVTAVTPPALPAAPGQPVNISWTVQNATAVATTATDWVDSVYISASATFDNSAVLVAQVPHSGAVTGGGTYGGNYTGPLPGVLAGNYYVFVRADSGQAVPDADRADNLGASGGTFAVTDPTVLTPGATPVNGTVPAGGDAWYWVDVPGGTGLTLTAAFAASGAGELYVGYQQFPQADTAVAAATDPANATQAVTLPRTQGGAYFLWVHGLAGGTFTVAADTVAFGITRLINAAGSNQGTATLTVHGVGFTPNTKVALAQGANTRAATSVMYVNGDTVYATFDLTKLAPGGYDVRATDGTHTATLAGGYSVTADPAGYLTYSIVQPDTVKSNEYGYATINFTNTGGTDLPAPLLILESPDGASVDLPGNPAPPFADNRVYFLPTSTDAPAGVIPPGYHGSLQARFKSFNADGSAVTLQLEQLNSAPIPWQDFSYLTSGIGVSAAAAKGIFANFVAKVGKTSDGYAAALRDAATYLAGVGTPINDAGALLGYLLAQADQSFPARTLAQVTDASFPAPGLALDFTRSFPTSVSGRNRLGRLGFGWVDNWDLSVNVPFQGSTKVFLDEAGVVREFDSATGSSGPFTPAGGGGDVLAFDGTRFVLTADDGTVAAFLANGLLDYVQDPGGTRVTAGYDAAGHLASLTHSDGRALTFTTNKAGQITSVKDPAGHVTAFKIAGSQLLSASGPDGTTTYGYAGGGPGVKHALGSITGPDKTKTVFAYDKLARLVKQSAGKTPVITYTYGPGGGVTATDPAGASTTVLQDADGLVAAIRDNSGADARVTHDAAGLGTRIETAAGQVWTLARDAAGHLVAQTGPLGHTVTYTYHGDNLAGVTDARGNTTGYQLDAAGHVLAITYPAGGGTEQFVCDPAGTLVETVNRRGHAVQTITNADGQVVRRVFADGSHTDYGYDVLGNLTSAADASGVTTLSYYPNDALQTITYPTGKSLTFAYDAGGRRSSSVDQDGFTTKYTYNATGRLSQLTDANGKVIAAYAYDAAGRLARQDNANGTFTTYAYDPAGRVTAVVNHKDANTVNSEFDYTYDAAGNVATVATAGVTTAYGYDAAGQLTSVTTPTRTITYTYDPSGNRTSVTDNGVTTTYTVNALNEVTAAGPATYTYDADGNRLTASDLTGTTNYTWDDLNRLTQSDSPYDTLDYTYDPFGNVSSVGDNGLTTTNLVDPIGGGTVAAQYGQGGLIAHYVQGLGLTARVDANGQAFYDFDQLGNAAGLTDPTGAYVNRYSYLPFGETTTLSSGLSNPFTYVGRWGVTSQVNGLFNMRARTYDPTVGSFISDDPLGLLAADPNFRRYVGNNPANFIDPLGLKCDQDELNRLTQQIDQIDAEFQNARDRLQQFRDLNAQLKTQPTVTVNGRQFDKLGLAMQYNQFKKVVEDLAPKEKARRQRLQDAYDACKEELDKKKNKGTPDLQVASPGLPKVPGSKPTKQTNQGPSHVSSTPNQSGHPAGAGGNGGKTGKARTGPRVLNAADGTTQQPYAVEFQNPSPSLPLHTLHVATQLDSDFDPATFRLGRLDLGALTINVPDGRTWYHTRADATALWGVYVDVSAGVDLATGLATWDVTAIDPATGDVPADPAVGFLVPTATAGSQDGAVYYTVGVRSNAVDGSSLDASADVRFDGGAPVTTATVSNVIDAAPPVATVTPLPGKSGSSFTVSWTGSDPGTGVAFYDLFVSVDGGSFVEWIGGTTATSARFKAKGHHRYGFVVVAHDNAGNVDPLPGSPQATTHT